jgi:hypothetical protein
MKFIKLFEDYRIIESTPEKFFLVLKNREEVYQALSQMEFKGLQGISDNPEIIKGFFDIRPIMLVMDGKEVLKLNNNLQKIDYSNPHQLVANNFEILTRLKQDREFNFWSIWNNIRNNLESIKWVSDWKIREKYPEFRTVSSFIIEHEYDLLVLMEKHFENGMVINNLWEYTNLIMSSIKLLLDEGNVRGENNSSHRYGYEGYEQDAKFILKNEKLVYFLLQETLLKIGSHWKNTEGEWIVKKNKTTGDRIFKVPAKSELWFKLLLDWDNPEDAEELKRYRHNNGNGFTDKTDYFGRDVELKALHDRIKDYNLDNLYDIRFVKGHLKAYDELSKYKNLKTKPYAALMKNPLDKRIKKNFYRK